MLNAEIAGLEVVTLLSIMRTQRSPPQREDYLITFNINIFQYNMRAYHLDIIPFSNAGTV